MAEQLLRVRVELNRVSLINGIRSIGLRISIGKRNLPTDNYNGTTWTVLLNGHAPIRWPEEL